jgi:hypothetical protein
MAAQLKDKRTTITTVPNILRKFAIFEIPLISHWSLPLRILSWLPYKFKSLKILGPLLLMTFPFLTIHAEFFAVFSYCLHFANVRSLSVSFFIEKEPHSQPRMKRKRKGGRRRKRHSTSTCESGQQTSLFTRSYQGLTDSLGQSLARTQPPPSP